MSKFENLKKKIKVNLRYIIGGIILFLGAIFMFVPFIPLGYLFLAIGALLLAPVIPALRKLLNWVEKKDKTNKIEKVEEKVDDYVKKKTED
jgi:UPF0716 family protein affecting phage T7 exclusion